MSVQMNLPAALSRARDFREACQLAGAGYLSVGRVLQEESEAAGRAYDAAFWPRAAAAAQLAGAIYTAHALRSPQNATGRAVADLRKNGLADFAEALESGDYAAHLAV